MTEAATVIQLGQEEVLLPGAVPGPCIHFILALIPGLAGLHPLLQPVVIGSHTCHSPTPATAWQKVHRK